MAGETPIRDWRLYWFGQLDRAITTANRKQIAQSLRNLSRLGIEVRFTLPLALPSDSERAVRHAD